MSQRTLKVAVLVAGLLLVSACSSGDGEAGSGEASTPPSAATNELRLVGSDLRFDAETLAAPAGAAFTIVFDNRDRGIPHNVAVYRSGPPAKDRVVATEIEPGPTTQRLAVPALDPGRYFYQCDAHPATMTGTLMVTSRR